MLRIWQIRYQVEGYRERFWVTNSPLTLSESLQAQFHCHLHDIPCEIGRIDEI